MPGLPGTTEQPLTPSRTGPWEVSLGLLNVSAEMHVPLLAPRCLLEV